MQKKIVVHMYLKNGKAVTGFDGKELLEDGDVMSIAQHYSNNGADELLIFDLSDDDADHEQSLNLIRQISRVIDIPMSGGGHIKNLEDVKKLLYAGCQQVFLNYAKAANIDLTEEVSKRFGKEKIAICTDSFAQLQANKARVNEYTSRVILLCDEVDVRTTARLVEVPVLPVSTRADRHGLLKLLMLDNICGVCGDTFSDLNEDLMAAKLEAKKHGVEINTFESKMSWNELKLNSDGMIPVVVQDYKNLEVLMVAYMNREAFEKTVESGKMTYWSRSRNELWQKGATSGHVQYVKQLSIDCDNDTILAKVQQIGAACHTGNRSCFYREILKKDYHETNPAIVFDHLYKLIEDRKQHPKEGSYTNYLLEQGIDKILKKVGEEATEIIIAAKNPNPEEIKYEISDFL